MNADLRGILSAFLTRGNPRRSAVIELCLCFALCLFPFANASGRDNRAYNDPVKATVQTRFEYRIRPRIWQHFLPSQSRPSLFGSD
jgi:hypothetical protein